jgi:Flp pilus assembly protein TadG
MLRMLELRKTEGGSAMVDFAVTAVVFLTVLFGIVDVGRAAFAYSWVSSAARQGSRFAMVRGTNCSGLSGGCPAQASDVTTYVNSLATGMDTSQLTVTAGCYTAGALLGAPPPCGPTTSVKVRVQYTFNFLSSLVPLSWNMQSISERVVQN